MKSNLIMQLMNPNFRDPVEIRKICDAAIKCITELETPKPTDFEFLELKIKLLKALVNKEKLKHFDKEDALNTIDELVRLVKAKL